jgi:hypothetical protein
VNRVLTALGSPIVLAPMAGGPTTPDLVSAVSDAGGFGFLAGGYLDPDALGAAVAAVRKRTEKPFGVNLFLPGERRDAGVAAYRERLVAAGLEPGEPVWDDDGYPGKLALLLSDPVPVVSFTFGSPDPDAVSRLHAVGSEVLATVTSPDEARQAAAAGVDGLVVQGVEAGAHRGVFDNDPADPAGGPQYGLLVASSTARASPPCWPGERSPPSSAPRSCSAPRPARSRLTAPRSAIPTPRRRRSPARSPAARRAASATRSSTTTPTRPRPPTHRCTT